MQAAETTIDEGGAADGSYNHIRNKRYFHDPLFARSPSIRADAAVLTPPWIAKDAILMHDLTGCAA